MPCTYVIEPPIVPPATSSAKPTIVRISELVCTACPV